jgi:hypothetical protein
MRRRLDAFDSKQNGMAPVDYCCYCCYCCCCSSSRTASLFSPSGPSRCQSRARVSRLSLRCCGSAPSELLSESRNNQNPVVGPGASPAAIPEIHHSAVAHFWWRLLFPALPLLSAPSGSTSRSRCASQPPRKWPGQVLPFGIFPCRIWVPVRSTTTIDRCALLSRLHLRRPRFYIILYY